MHPDLERVIHLQQIEDAAERARRTIADEPVRQQELAAALEAVRQALESERARLSANQAAKRDIEKELAMQQARLSKFRDQLMEVKTNREYQAMQKEIETAQHEIRKHEDRLLERMIEFDEVTLHVKQAEQAYLSDQAANEAERSGASGLMGKVLERRNLQAALKRVRKNKGSPGIDGMTVDELPDHLRAHWAALREQLLSGAYQPASVKRQLIPKGSGGVRELGIPTVLDRFIQQALLQVLQPRFDPSFS